MRNKSCVFLSRLSSNWNQNFGGQERDLRRIGGDSARRIWVFSKNRDVDLSGTIQGFLAMSIPPGLMKGISVF